MVSTLIETIKDQAYPLQGIKSDFDQLLDRARDADIVLLGESTHGTSEFYELRAEISKRLIEEANFSAIALEGDWPDIYRVNRYIQNDGSDSSVLTALDDLQKFPSWIWRNKEFAGFLDWLHHHNLSKTMGIKVGVYGLDLYSLYGSMAAVLNYLHRVDPAAAEAARAHYSEFPSFGDGGNSYSFADLVEVPNSCIEGAIKEVSEIQRNRYTNLKQRGLLPIDAQFSAEQNAQIIARAEEYYRQLFISKNSEWNLRETHMCGTLYRILKHLELSQKARPKIIVWAHNAHIGDARNHEMLRRQELSMGQMLRENPSIKTISIGFTTSTGTVAAASYWQGEVTMRALPAPHPESIEAAFSATGLDRFILFFEHPKTAWYPLCEEMLERSIGAIYIPEIEGSRYYARARLALQFDGVLHVDYSKAVTPLESVFRSSKELPETFPSGL